MAAKPAREQFNEHLKRQRADIPVFGAELAFLAHDGITRGDTDLSNEAHNEARMLVEKIKILAGSTDEDDKASVGLINNHFDTHERPVLFEEPPATLSSLPGPDIVRWLTLAPYRDVAVFSLWNYRYQKELQRRLVEVQPVFHEDILTKAKYLVDSDMFPAHALGLYQKSCAATRVIKPIDSFFLGSGDVAGYQNSREIGLSSPFKDPHFRELDAQAAHHCMFHEMTHDVGGQSNKWDIDYRGFHRGITQQFAYHRATEEFFVEHASAVSMSKTDPGIIDPDDRPGDLRIYYQERKLHAIISRDHIPVDLWGHAYIESRHSLRGWRLRRDLARRIGSAFGSWQRYMEFSRMDDDLPNGTERNIFLENVTAKLSSEPLVGANHD